MKARTLRVLLHRTVLAWRWWLLLPLMPIFVCLVLMYMALETAEEYITEIIAWKRRGDRL